MKRIILSVFAAAVTAAWVVPASAGDVTFSGQYRLRGEFIDNTDYDENLSDTTDFVTQRLRLTANAKATDDVSVKVTLQDTRTWGTDDIVGVTTGSSSLLTDATFNKIDTHEAYINVNNIFGTPVAFRAGRQELVYGDERLIGNFGWSNNGRAFDGVKFMYASDMLNVDAFAMNVLEDTSSSLNDDRYFNGVYATLKQIIPDNTLDVYFLQLNNGSTAVTPNNLYTIGARLKGMVAGIDYTVELPYQFGDFSPTVETSAWAFAAKAGYTLPTPMKIRVGAEYDFATGDTDSADTDQENFNQLFPTNHMHFGIGDVAVANTWSDISVWSINASVDATEQLRLYAAYWNYTEAEVLPGESDEIGSEIDFIATYKYNNAVTLEGGLARFTPGDRTVSPGTPDDSRDWAYLQITGNF
jgi:hypothetical protein